MSKYNYQGLLTTVYGVMFSLGLGVIATPNIPDFSMAICNVASPIAEFQDERQFAESVNDNDKCIESTKISQYFLVSFLIFLSYTQLLHCLILGSYLFSKYETKKNEEKFYTIENAEHMYSGLIEDHFKAKKPMFDNLEEMKASYLAQKIAVDAFCASIEARDHTQEVTKPVVDETAFGHLKK
jgi:hypothetical protein